MSFTFALFLIASIAFASPAPQLDAEFRQAKGNFFKTLLNETNEAEIAKDKERLASLNLARAQAAIADALEGNASKAPLPKIHVPESGARLAEMDMIRNAQDLKKSEQEKLVKIYRAAATEMKKLGAEKASTLRRLRAKPKGSESLKNKFIAICARELKVMIAALSDSAKIIRSTPLDRDYAYRAYLREHRRTIPGFSTAP